MIGIWWLTDDDGIIELVYSVQSESPFSMAICRSNLLLVLDVKMLSNSQSSQTEASNQMHVGD